MSLYALRLRRTLTTLSSLINHHRFLPAISSPSPFLLQNLISSSSSSSSSSPTIPSQSRPFRSSAVSLSSARSYNNSNDDDNKLPDILFEGCDYNHWLITMDFPKDPKPTPEEMVETYVQTCAKGLNISVEEAKKKIYACSTTTYVGFQAVMTEEESEKFKGLPGVVFILPDSYIDPVNKEYGGDKYINGTIIPRPPPVQYGRSGGRYGDRNRNLDRQRYDRQGGPPNRQGNPPYEPQGPMQGDGRNYGAPQNYSPQPNDGPTRQGERRDSMPMNNTAYGPGGVGTYQGERRDPIPSHQGNYNQVERGNYYSQERKDFSQGDRRDFAAPEQRDFRGDNRNYSPPHAGNYGQGAGGAHGHGPSGGYGQGAGGAHGQGPNGGFGQGVGGSYGHGAGLQYGGGSYGQRAGLQGAVGSNGQGVNLQGAVGSYGQEAASGYGRQGAIGSNGQGVNLQGAVGSYGQEAASGYGRQAASDYGQSYPGHGEGQRPSQVEQWNYAPVGQTRTDQK